MRELHSSWLQCADEMIAESWELQAEFALQSLDPVSPRQMSFAIQSFTHEEKIVIFRTLKLLIIYPFGANIWTCVSKELHIMPARNQLPVFIGRRNCIFMPFWTFILNRSLLICVDIEEKTVLFLEMRGPVLSRWTVCGIAKATLALRGRGSQRWVSLFRGLSFFTSKRGALFIEHSQNLRKLFLPRGPE